MNIFSTVVFFCFPYQKIRSVKRIRPANKRGKPPNKYDFRTAQEHGPALALDKYPRVRRMSAVSELSQMLNARIRE